MVERRRRSEFCMERWRFVENHNMIFYLYISWILLWDMKVHRAGAYPRFPWCCADDSHLFPPPLNWTQVRCRLVPSVSRYPFSAGWTETMSKCTTYSNKWPQRDLNQWSFYSVVIYPLTFLTYGSDRIAKINYVIKTRGQ